MAQGGDKVRDFSWDILLWLLLSLSVIFCCVIKITSTTTYRLWFGLISQQEIAHGGTWSHHVKISGKPYEVTYSFKGVEITECKTSASDKSDPAAVRTQTQSRFPQYEAVSKEICLLHEKLYPQFGPWSF